MHPQSTPLPERRYHEERALPDDTRLAYLRARRIIVEEQLREARFLVDWLHEDTDR